MFPNGRLYSEIISIENGICIIKAFAYENKEDEKPIATGTAYEKEGSTFINKTSYIENCETSAYGRCLGMCGIGIDTSISSAEEVANKIQQQESENKIDKKMIESLNLSIENNKISNNIVDLILSQYGYKQTNEIKIKDYMNIVNDFKTKVSD